MQTDTLIYKTGEKEGHSLMFQKFLPSTYYQATLLLPRICTLTKWKYKKTALPSHIAGTESCGEITLTLEGVTSDPKGLADMSTYEASQTGWFRIVHLKFDHITKMEVTQTLGGQCSNEEITVKGWTGKSYTIYNNTAIYIDLGCEAEFLVCGTSKSINSLINNLLLCFDCTTLT